MATTTTTPTTMTRHAYTYIWSRWFLPLLPCISYVPIVYSMPKYRAIPFGGFWFVCLPSAFDSILLVICIAYIIDCISECNCIAVDISEWLNFILFSLRVVVLSLVGCVPSCSFHFYIISLRFFFFDFISMLYKKIHGNVSHFAFHWWIWRWMAVCWSKSAEQNLYISCIRHFSRMRKIMTLLLSYNYSTKSLAINKNVYLTLIQSHICR